MLVGTRKVCINAFSIIHNASNCVIQYFLHPLKHILHITHMAECNHTCMVPFSLVQTMFNVSLETFISIGGIYIFNDRLWTTIVNLAVKVSPIRSCAECKMRNNLTACCQYRQFSSLGDDELTVGNFIHIIPQNNAHHTIFYGSSTICTNITT